MFSGQRDRLRPPRGPCTRSWRMPGVRSFFPSHSGLPYLSVPTSLSCLCCIWRACTRNAMLAGPWILGCFILNIIPQFGCYKIDCWDLGKTQIFLPGRGESKINYQRKRTNSKLWSRRGQGGLALGRQWYSVQIMGRLVTDVFSSFPVIPLSFLLPQGFSPHESMPFIISRRRMGENKNN